MFRNIFVLVCPVLMTLVLVFAAAGFIEQQQQASIGRKLDLWRSKAELALASVRSAHTFADLYSQFGNRLAQELELADDDLSDGRFFTAQQKKHYSAAFLHSHAQTWFFTVKEGKARPVVTEGLAGNRLRAMQKLFEGLIEFAGNKGQTVSQTGPVERFIKGVLGPLSAPLSIGRRREGKLTPVVFEGKPSYFYWRQYSRMNKTVAGSLTIFPAAIVEDRVTALQFVASRLIEQTHRHLAVAFIPVDHFKTDIPPIFPEIFNQNEGTRNLVLNLITEVKKNSEDWGNSAYQRGGYLFLRGFLTADLPYDAIVFAPSPSSIKHSRPGKLLLASLVLVFWAGIFLYFQFSRGRAGLPLAVAFRILFFFTGLLPIFIMLAQGFSLVDSSYETELFEVRQETVAKLNNIDEKSDNLLPMFGYHVSKALKMPGIHGLLSGGSRNDCQQAFEQITASLRSLELTLDYMFVFTPGVSSEMFLHDQRSRANVKANMDFFAPSVYGMNLSFSRLQPLPEIMLDPVQKNFYKIFSIMPNDFLHQTFMLCYEKESYAQFGEASKDYYFSVILSEQGKIRSYVILGAKSEQLYRNFLARELDLMNVSQAHTFLAVEERSNSDFTIFPANKMQILNTRFGRNALSFLQQCRSSIFEKYLAEQDYMYLFYPMSKMKGYAGGCIISLAEINHNRNFKRLTLVVITVLLVCIMYFVSALATMRLLEPLTEINSALQRISTGDLEIKIAVNSRDELGLLGSSINQMVDGFKERLRLGKFVSTTLDKSLSHGLSLEELKKARIITGTVLFSDIRSFTTLSESHPPAEIAMMLNQHLDVLSEVIQDLGGQIEQFIGDAIVAFFPDDKGEESKSQAVRAAIAVYRAHAGLNQHRQESGRFTYAIGIGLQHGQVIAGSLVTPARSEFSIIGNARNEAENFEALSKLGSHSKIIVSGAFLADIESEKLAGHRQLVGTDVFELIVEEPAV